VAFIDTETAHYLADVTERHITPNVT